jgi:hypothetical protein
MSELYTEHLHDSEPDESLGSPPKSPQMAVKNKSLPVFGRQICICGINVKPLVEFPNVLVMRRFHKDVCIIFLTYAMFLCNVLSLL